jgi:hypothetical protein
METMNMQIHMKQLPNNTQNLKEMLHADVVEILLHHGVQVTDVVTQFNTQQPLNCVQQSDSNTPSVTPSSTSKVNKKKDYSKLINDSNKRK